MERVQEIGKFNFNKFNNRAAATGPQIELACFVLLFTSAGGVVGHGMYDGSGWTKEELDIKK